MPVNSGLEKKTPYQPYEGFGFLSRSQALLAEYHGHLTRDIAKEIIGLASLAIQLLTQYPYFLARAHRVVGEVLEETGDLDGAICDYTKALKYDPKVGVKKKLAEMDPASPAGATREKRPPFQIACADLGAITYLSKRKSVPAGQAPRGTYYKTTCFDNFCAYSKNHYNHKDGDPPDAPPTGETTISFTTHTGEWIGQRRFDHLVYHFACGANPSVIATISFDLKLRLYLHGQAKPVTQKIEGRVDRYQINGLHLSLDGSRVYYLAGETLHILNHNLEPIAERKFSLSSREDSLVLAGSGPQTTSPALSWALAVFKLKGNPTNEEIQKAYRARLLEVHPDRHADNPHANEETMEVIEAYEVLTKGEYLDVNIGFHKQVFVIFENYFPAFENAITAVCISEDPREMYLGYWSGQVLRVEEGLEPELVFKSERSVRELEEVNGSLYIRSDRITILRRSGWVKQMSEPGSYGIYWKIFPADGLFVLRNGARLAFHTLDGESVGEIEMRDSIADYYFVGGNVIVYTANFIYEFAVRIRPVGQGRYLATSNQDQ